MKKNNIKIKEVIDVTFSDKVNAILEIASSCFVNDMYTPYYREMAEIIAIATSFIEGLEFEENESIYTEVIKDPQVMNLVKLFYNPTTEIYNIMEYVNGQADDIINFEKQKLIHKNKDMSKIVEVCNIIIDSFDNFSKLNIGQMTKEDMNVAIDVMKKLSETNFTKEDLSEVLKNASKFNMDKATEEIIEAKNSEIRELKKYKTLCESRNVVNENKVVEMSKKNKYRMRTD